MSLHPRKELTMTTSALKACRLNSESIVVARLKQAVTGLLLRLSHSACEFLRKEDLNWESFEMLEQKHSPQSLRKRTG